MKLIKGLGKKIVNLYNDLSDADSSWTNRRYDFYLIFGSTDELKAPWIQTNWKRDFQPYFDLLLKQVNNSNGTGIRVDKFNLERRVSKNNNETFVYHAPIKVGRLKWDEKSHEKWTVSDNSENYFQRFELWSPIWTKCERRDIPPEIYITITNQRGFQNGCKIEFGYFMVIAVAKNLNIDSKSILKELSEKIDSKATIFKTRRWGKPEKFGDWTFLNWIQDTYMVLYKEESLHTFDFNSLEFQPHWEVLYRHT
ncbi:hypothetical protein [Sphingobacterium siyangense]|uniref:Uncharacterized protein n=2 Tax=Sphingobacterium TaxID=28453 RepID=A0A420FJY1_9SPHI|nr:hypothetical protein [Sphingobacterium siyangense]RKF33223.1 hypothetical protein BCY89_13440 [Sphingobacterium siyangense]